MNGWMDGPAQATGAVGDAGPWWTEGLEEGGGWG